MTSLPDDDEHGLIILSGSELSEDLLHMWVSVALSEVPMVPRLCAALVVEELVSNVFNHARLPCMVMLCLDSTRRYLQVFVDDFAADDGAVWPRGGGLSLVEGLTSDWAVDFRPAGKTVWAEITLGARIPSLETWP